MPPMMGGSPMELAHAAPADGNVADGPGAMGGGPPLGGEWRSASMGGMRPSPGVGPPMTGGGLPPMGSPMGGMMGSPAPPGGAGPGQGATQGGMPAGMNMPANIGANAYGAARPTLPPMMAQKR